ncbi:hypothetical protein A4X06_0g7815 [Tilletia controversa]|uniref:Flavin reductase like domain-containing protein n=1 Tax=Tilletia controversa TaxID=13291 RepID=A0A8X7MMA0_9BASI|nr:hypothetical protein CF328_g7204 [Tilletia controversa]KAE8240325.1 hypothetical protein A4X06_0g7815 [Tilletia controversa]
MMATAAAMTRTTAGSLLRKCARHPSPYARSSSSSSSSSRSLPTTDSVQEQLRAAMRDVAQPVAIITTHLPSSSLVHGATVSSFTTISMNPPLVAFSLRTPSRLAHALQRQQPDSAKDQPHFLINLLSHTQADTAAAFAKPGLVPLRFDPARSSLRSSSSSASSPSPPTVLDNLPVWLSRTTPDQIPALKGCMSALACRLEFKLDLSSPPSPLVGNDEMAEDEAIVGEGTASSQLFVARVCAVEQEREQEEGSKSTPSSDSISGSGDPLVYHRHKFCTIAHARNHSTNNDR